jgi:rhamnogalacturonyl hydrolase YesR
VAGTVSARFATVAASPRENWCDVSYTRGCHFQGKQQTVYHTEEKRIREETKELDCEALMVSGVVATRYEANTANCYED